MRTRKATLHHSIISVELCNVFFENACAQFGAVKSDHSGLSCDLNALFYLHFSRILCFIFGKVSRVQLQHNWQLINCILIKRSTKSPSICFPFLLFRRLRDCLEHNNNGGVSRYNLRIFGECEAICSVLFPQELRDKWERWLRCDKNTENVLRDEKRQNYNNKIM